MKRVHIPLHTFLHFREILILYKKRLIFHQKTVTSSEMMQNMKYEKDALGNVPDTL